MVHQELSIAANLSVAENVLLGVQPVNRLGMIRWRAMADNARGHLEQLGIDVDPRAEAGLLPLGLQQLVELSRVLFSGARVIILDEPTSALSPPEVENLFSVLRRLRKSGTSFIFISHFLEDVLAVSDRVTVFRNARRVATEDVANVDKLWLIEQMIGSGPSELGETYLNDIDLHSDPDAAVVLETEHHPLRGNFNDLSLQVRAGEVLGVYGFMGSGQLELAKALSGKLRVRHGLVKIDAGP
jgi:ribose transport system ATP-binding protein